jgi:AraC-like DNA-binding protein
MAGLELTLRVLGVALLAILATLMLRARRPDHAAGIGAALAISVAAFLLTSMRNASQLFGALTYPLSAICSTHPVWFWLFCSAVFGDRMRLALRHVACLAAMASVGLAVTSVVSDNPQGSVRWLAIAFAAASLLFIGLGPLTVFLGARSDLDARRRRIRTWFVPVVSAYLATVVLVQAYVMLTGQPTPRPLVLLNLAVIDSLALAALLTFVQIKVFNWLDLVEPAPTPDRLSRLELSVLERLNRRLVPERLYARELSIATLAEALGTQEHVLRRVINRGLGFRNFNDFLHSHRLREAGARLRDPAEQRVPILTIALEVGYGSVGPFNRAFKERFGMTPTEYRRMSAEPPAARNESVRGPVSPSPRA